MAKKTKAQPAPRSTPAADPPPAQPDDPARYASGDLVTYCHGGKGQPQVKMIVAEAVVHQIGDKAVWQYLVHPPAPEPSPVGEGKKPPPAPRPKLANCLRAREDQLTPRS